MPSILTSFLSTPFIQVTIILWQQRGLYLVQYTTLIVKLRSLKGLSHANEIWKNKMARQTGKNTSNSHVNQLKPAWDTLPGIWRHSPCQHTSTLVPTYIRSLQEASGKSSLLQPPLPIPSSLNMLQLSVHNRKEFTQKRF